MKELTAELLKDKIKTQQCKVNGKTYIYYYYDLVENYNVFTKKMDKKIFRANSIDELINLINEHLNENKSIDITSDVTFNELFKSFIAHAINGGKVPATLALYQQYYNKISKVIGNIKVSDYNESVYFQVEHLDIYKSERNRILSLRFLYNLLMFARNCGIDIPDEYLKNFVKESDSRAYNYKTYSYNDYKQIINQTNEVVLYPYLYLISLTGISLHEILVIQKKNLDINEGDVLISKVFMAGKNNKTYSIKEYSDYRYRRIKLCPKALEYLKDKYNKCLNDNDYLLCDNDNLRNRNQLLNQLLFLLLKRLNIQTRYTFDDIRSISIVLLFRKYQDELAICKYCGIKKLVLYLKRLESIYNTIDDSIDLYNDVLGETLYA